MLSEDDISFLRSLTSIYLNNPFIDYEDFDPVYPRIMEMSPAQEKRVAEIYLKWRGRGYDLACDECMNEAFDRLIKKFVIHA